MGMSRKIKPSSKKSRAFSYSQYTGKIVRDFRERQAGEAVADRLDAFLEELEREPWKQKTDPDKK